MSDCIAFGSALKHRHVRIPMTVSVRAVCKVLAKFTNGYIVLIYIVYSLSFDGELCAINGIGDTIIYFKLGFYKKKPEGKEK